MAAGVRNWPQGLDPKVNRPYQRRGEKCVQYAFTGNFNPANPQLGDDLDLTREAQAAGKRAVDAFCSKSIIPCGPVMDAEAEKAVADVEKAGTLSQRVVRTAEGRDKIAKFSLGILEVLNYWMKGNPNISESTREGFHKFETMGVKPARTVFALMNIFAGVLSSIKATAIALVYLVKGMVTGRERVSIFNSTLGEEVTYRGRGECVVGFFAMLGQLGGATAYTAGFGVCSPIKCVDSYWKGAMGESTRNVGNKFPFIMMLNHFSVFFGNLWDLVYTGMEYHNSEEGDVIAVRKFYGRLTMIISSMLEKTAEFGCDLINVFKIDAPPIVKPICTLVYSGISLWRAVHKADIDMEGQIRKKAEETQVAKIKASLAQNGVQLARWVQVHGSLVNGG